MLILELSSIKLEIPNDAYTTLNGDLIGCSTLSQEYCKLIGKYRKNEKATLNINNLLLGWRRVKLTGYILTRVFYRQN